MSIDDFIFTAKTYRFSLFIDGIDPMKILIISDAWKPQLNGVVRTYECLIEELKKQGHDVKIIGPADFPKRVRLPGYTEIELALFPYRRLSKAIREFWPDTIHIATEATLGRAARRYCLKHGLNFTSSYHTHFPDYIAKRLAKYLPFLYRPVKNAAIKMLRKFHAPSSSLMIATQSLEDELRERKFTAPIIRFTRGVDVGIFKPEKPSILPALKDPVAIYVGRVAIEKNIEDFASMDWHGSKIIVGDGPSLNEMKRKYPDIHFAGRQTGQNLAAHYNRADIFVFPSRTDTSGIVLIEALACGLPVAAYDVTGPKDIITEENLGSLHDDDLSIAAKKALQSAALNEDKRVQHVHKHYTWKTAAEQFLDGCIHCKEKNKSAKKNARR